MPTKAKTHGATLLRQGYGGRAPDDRASAALRGYGRVWRRLRRMVLARQPLCGVCLAHGYHVAASQVDHIVPLSAGGSNSMANLQGLCAMHHSQKTGRQRFTTEARRTRSTAEGTEDGNGREGAG